MRYQVPQFVDIEDKIVGPLTLKQFLIYFCTVLMLIPVYLFSDLSLFFALALPVLGVAAAFAHFKPGGKPLFTFIGHMLRFTAETKIWTWRRTTMLKPLPVAGMEFDTGAPAGEMALPSLQAKAQAIETEGNVSQADEEDPMLSEEQTQNSKPKSQNLNPKLQTS